MVLDERRFAGLYLSSPSGCIVKLCDGISFPSFPFATHLETLMAKELKKKRDEAKQAWENVTVVMKKSKNADDFTGSKKSTRRSRKTPGRVLNGGKNLGSRFRRREHARYVGARVTVRRLFLLKPRPLGYGRERNRPLFRLNRLRSPFASISYSPSGNLSVTSESIIL